MRRCSTNAKARVAQLNGFSPITAAAELSVAFGDCFYRWKARLLGGRGSSSAQGIGGRVRAPAPTQMQELFPPICRGRSQTGPRAATWGRPYEIRGTLRSFRRGRRPRRPAGAHCAPLRRKTAPGRWFGNGRRKSGTAPTPIFHKPRAQWPGRNRTQALLILRAGNVLPTSRGNPRKMGSRGGEYERGALILSRALALLWFLSGRPERNPPRRAELPAHRTTKRKPSVESKAAHRPLKRAVCPLPGQPAQGQYPRGTRGGPLSAARFPA